MQKESSAKTVKRFWGVKKDKKKYKKGSKKKWIPP